MPRSTPDRTIGGDRTVARRVAEEREARDWTYDVLSRRMEAAGCPIHISALHKLEKARPPRRVTVDELVAFSLVFEMPVEELITPSPLLRDRKLRGLVNRWWQARESLAQARQDLRTQELALRVHLSKTPDAGVELENALEARAVEASEDPDEGRGVAAELAMLLSRPWTSLSREEAETLDRRGAGEVRS